MIKRNFKILLSYIIGVLTSMFLAVPLSPILGFSTALFSLATALITASFIYSQMWKAGKYDSLKKVQSFKKPLLGMVGFTAISIVIILIVALYNPTGNIDKTMLIGTIWFFPFMGFFGKETFVFITLLVVMVILIISLIAYYMGIKGFSLTDKIFSARKKRIDQKAKKHFDEIEKIKEEYRNKKAVD